MDLRDNEHFFQLIEEKNIIIYGDGYVGKQFLKVLRLNNLENKVICFTKSIVNDYKFVDGIPVQPIEYVKKLNNVIICIAVHETNKDEIIISLEKTGIYNYVWVYPVIFSLMLGKPVKRDVEVPVKKIIKNNLGDYRIAARYLVIDNYYGKNEIGYDIYIKLMKLHASHETAVKRLSSFIELIKSWEVNGYNKDKCIDILENGILIDGTHRFTLGVYFRLEKMMADIYDIHVYNNICEIHGEEAIMGKDVVKAKLENKNIINLLNEVNNKIMLKYKGF